MKAERFIARRFMPRHDGGFSGPLSGIAVVAVALGVLVMVMAVSILRGFQHEIADKVAGFGSHLTVQAFQINPSYVGETPVAADTTMAADIAAINGVKHVQMFGTKGGMVKTSDQIYGIIFRGLQADYDSTFFLSCLKSGNLPRSDNEVLISTTIASRLNLTVGEKMRTYFWHGEHYRQRAFTVSGTYDTDLKEMDELYVMGSLATLQKLCGWGDTLVGGYEVLVDDLDHLDAVAEQVLQVLPYTLTVQTIVEANKALFSWLDLLNSNITLILTIMCLVCAVAIVSAFLIMIFEKSSTIGLLKALGATGRSVRSIFLLKAGSLIIKGILAGDALALVLSAVQWRWHLIRLDPESYSMGYVPIEIDPAIYIGVSLGVVAVCMLALILPSNYISRISPAKTLRVE